VEKVNLIFVIDAQNVIVEIYEYCWHFLAKFIDIFTQFDVFILNCRFALQKLSFCINIDEDIAQRL